MIASARGGPRHHDAERWMQKETTACCLLGARRGNRAADAERWGSKMRKPRGWGHRNCDALFGIARECSAGMRLLCDAGIRGGGARCRLDLAQRGRGGDGGRDAVRSRPAIRMPVTVPLGHRPDTTLIRPLDGPTLRPRASASRTDAKRPRDRRAGMGRDGRISDPWVCVQCITVRQAARGRRRPDEWLRKSIG